MNTTEDNGLMSAVNPHKSEYDTPDGLKIAKDVSWVIRTLWGGGVIFCLAAYWVIALAQDVKTNTSKIEEAATKEQVQQVLDALTELKQDIRDVDTRQRSIQSQLDKVEERVNR